MSNAALRDFIYSSSSSTSAAVSTCTPRSVVSFAATPSILLSDTRKHLQSTAREKKAVHFSRSRSLRTSSRATQTFQNNVKIEEGIALTSSKLKTQDGQRVRVKVNQARAESGFACCTQYNGQHGAVRPSSA